MSNSNKDKHVAAIIPPMRVALACHQHVHALGWVAAIMCAGQPLCEHGGQAHSDPSAFKGHRGTLCARVVSAMSGSSLHMSSGCDH